ncbi:hypothetical protein [Rouxiella badensis]|uniref:hypothetical protein n=1 Tax=Rouxiella badensis TaxID=1646377 RepID=UPI0017883D30|nr:hypothetical protein [Rouxiella badensis]QOI55675.1 hypothetical protein H2866_00340 [Rouxiella badensis subsp. acadiensis]
MSLDNKTLSAKLKNIFLLSKVDNTKRVIILQNEDSPKEILSFAVEALQTLGATLHVITHDPLRGSYTLSSDYNLNNNDVISKNSSEDLLGLADIVFETIDLAKLSAQNENVESLSLINK